MPSYTYQPELPHGLPTISQAQGLLTPPDTPPYGLEMAQELSHGLPLLDTDIDMEDETIDPMLIDEEPMPELMYRGLGKVIHYVLPEYNITIEQLWYDSVEFYVDDQGSFAQVVRVEEFRVVIEYRDPNEQFSGYQHGGVPEVWNWPLDDLL